VSENFDICYFHLNYFNFSLSVSQFSARFNSVEDFRNLYASPIIIKVIKPRRMRWAGNLTRMEEMKNVSNILARKPEGDY